MKEKNEISFMVAVVSWL